MSTFIVDKNQPGKVVVVVNTGLQGPTGGSSPPGGVVGQLQYHGIGDVFAPVRETFTDATGGLLADKDVSQNVKNEVGDDYFCVWSRAHASGDTIFGSYNYITYGANADDDKVAPVVYVRALMGFAFQTGASGDANFASILGVQATGTSTGVGIGVLPNLAVISTPVSTFDANNLFGGGKGVIGLQGAATNPPSNPAGGIAAYSDAANSFYFSYKLPSGLVAVPINTITNVGGGVGLAKAKSGINNDIKTLVAGANVTITPGTDTVTIAASGGSSFTPPTGTGLMTVTGGAMNGAALASGVNGYYLGWTGGVPVFQPISASDIFGIPGSSGQYLYNSGGAIGAKNIVASDISSVPGTNNPLYGNAGAMSAASNWTIGTGLQGGAGSFATLASFLSVGTNPAAGPAHIRLPDDGEIHFRNSSNTGDIGGLYCTGGSLYIGSYSSGATFPGNIYLSAGSNTVVPNGAFEVTNSLYINGTTVDMAKPVGGHAALSVPFQFAQTTIAISGGTNTTTPAQYACPFITMTGGTFTAGTALELPDKPGAVFFIYNATGSAIIIRKFGSSSLLTQASGTFACWGHVGAGADYVKTS